MRTVAKVAAWLPLFLLTSASVFAAVLLPGNFLVSASDRLVLIDPDGRPPQIVTSATHGDGVPYDAVSDIEIGTDGFVYAAVPGGIIRIDPSTGNREEVSTNSRGLGPLFNRPTALSFDTDGTLYVVQSVSDSAFTVRHSIIAVDEQSGDRELVASATSFDTNGKIWDMDFHEDGRLILVGGTTNNNIGYVYAVNLDTGMSELNFASQSLYGTGTRIVRSRVSNFYYAIEGAGSGAAIKRVIELRVDSSLSRRVLVACDQFESPFEAAPLDVAVDAGGFLILVASGGSGSCSASAPEGLTPRIYKIDPETGASSLLFGGVSEFDRVAFHRVIIVPEDFPFDDQDLDGVADSIDNCPSDDNPSQHDLDSDGVGDACNDAVDFDGDEIADLLDVCVDVFDPLQIDVDGDGDGDACDAFPFDPDNVEAQLRQDLGNALQELAVCIDRPRFEDTDQDGEDDRRDRCAGTRAGAQIDDSGCSIQQFCGSPIATHRTSGFLTCLRRDWLNDEPDKVFARDCTIAWAGNAGLRGRLRCVPDE